MHVANGTARQTLNPDLSQLTAKLKATEEALQISDRLAMAGLHAQKALEEAAIPIEILSNLVYLSLSRTGDQDGIMKYMGLAELQTKKLTSLCQDALRTYRDET